MGRCKRTLEKRRPIIERARFDLEYINNIHHESRRCSYDCILQEDLSGDEENNRQDSEISKRLMSELSELTNLAFHSLPELHGRNTVQLWTGLSFLNMSVNDIVYILMVVLVNYLEGDWALGIEAQKPMYTTHMITRRLKHAYLVYRLDYSLNSCQILLARTKKQ